ncbi:trehalose-phosphatase [candidate division KSB1 bacterium]|nr:trehalose-phosphatase [candidate division KSB1 bacterium]NIR70166.1 trehalose-phosphatase [candidate division KSB1 bacterium]NIS27552.1 trehalose-phosphatase [candidate division KSB1 bacterium]NIT74405.1 trehalose-phosphatase [candidate division KSB1 bacterium]NIU28270.1 trehalose-phosphatase [candidate division KSB1 bacterium]
MRILNPKFYLDEFFQTLKKANERALLLDYDGTLAPFREKRNEATPYPGIREILTKILQANHSRVAVISGRYSQDLIPLIGLRPLPEIWGSHGMERLKSNGDYELAQLDETVSNKLKEIKQWVEYVALEKHSEEKPGAFAIHWREFTNERKKEIRELIKERWASAAGKAGLAIKEFDGGIEFRAVERNKGDAVNTILAEMGDDCVAAYLGDDLTDEDAFQAIKGRGIGILVRQEFRKTCADMWLKPPEELLEFLSNWHNVTGGGK